VAGLSLATHATEGTELVRSVFIHDLSVTTPERAFVSKNFPEATFSDNHVFAETAAVVDESIRSELPPSIRLDGFTGPFGYGFCPANIPFEPNRSYRLLLLKAWAADLFYRLAG
jgi:hypothetical protein